MDHTTTDPGRNLCDSPLSFPPASGPPCPHCGDPAAELSRLHQLLEAWDAARRAEQVAQVDGDRDGIVAAGWEVAERLADVQRHRQDAATVLAMHLRWLDELYPAAVGPLRDHAERLSDIEAAVAGEVAHAHA